MGLSRREFYKLEVVINKIGFKGRITDWRTDGCEECGHSYIVWKCPDDPEECWEGVCVECGHTDCEGWNEDY